MPKKNVASSRAGKAVRTTGEGIMGGHSRSARMPILRAGEDEAKPGWAAMLCCGAMTSSKETHPRAEVLLARPGAATEEQRAAGIVETFCEHVPATRVEPTQAELESLWMKCSNLRAVVMAEALVDQLAKATGEQNWQAQVRALHVLTYLYTKGHGGKHIAQVVMNSARELLQHLAKETEECHGGANLALLVAQLAGVVPSGEEVNIAKGGGLMYFMGGDSRHSSSSVGGLVESSHNLKATTLQGQSCEQAEPQTTSAAVETSEDLLSMSAAVEAAPMVPTPPSAASAKKQDLICLTSVRQEDLISLDAAPDVVGGGTSHVSVTKALAEVLVPAQELAGISFERSPDTPAPKPNFGANLGGQHSSQLKNRMAGFRPRPAAYIPLVTDQFMQEQFPRTSDPFAALAEHVHDQLKSC